jgi:hypothetical protein
VDRYTQKVHIKAAEHRKILADVNQLAMDIGRCEKTIGSVMAELNSANTKYSGERNTRQEVELLKILLDCAKRKLAWEKQIASLKKRAPALLESMVRVMNDKDFPPSSEMSAEMLNALKLVQGALERLQAVEVSE